MSELTLACAQAVAAAAISSAQERQMQIAIAVVDVGGWPVLQLRMDGAFPASVDAALAKARTAALYRRPTSTFSDRVKAGMPLAHLPHVVPLGGGVLLEIEGNLLGALGLSGAQEDAEKELAEELAATFARG